MCAHARGDRFGVDTTGWAPRPADAPEARLHRGIVRSSHYVAMRDGVRIAVDLYLPADLEPGEKIPAVLRQTRYYRTWAFRWPFRLFLEDPVYGSTRKRLVTHGYAWIDVDVRGTGASFGQWIWPWSPDEVRDGGEIVDWVLRQPWSNGRVGATGISYDGTAAEFLLVNDHPAVKAVMPRFTLFDVYTDSPFPGGIHFAWFTKAWGEFNRALDRNAPWEAGGWRMRLGVSGVAPVDPDPRVLEEALAQHRSNFRVHELALSMTFRDDPTPDFPGRTIDVFSPHAYVPQVRASGAAIYNYSGWFDGDYANAAIRRFLTVKTPGSRLILGPWDHGGFQNMSPFRQSDRSIFDHDGEQLRFFDRYLKDVPNGIDREKPVAYFTMGEERWKQADTWPPPATEPLALYFAAESRLSGEAPTDRVADDTYWMDPTAGTGHRSRWDALLNIYHDPLQYGDRREADRKLRCYTTQPLAADVEVTGHPLVTLWVGSTASDGTFFVYLEDVGPEGGVAYVTEGELRALDRKMSPEKAPYVTPVPYRTYLRKDALPLAAGEPASLVFDLLPTSYVFKKGHSIRVAVAGADRDHFALLPGPPPTVRIYRSAPMPSHVVLPVMMTGR